MIFNIPPENPDKDYLSINDIKNSGVHESIIKDWKPYWKSKFAFLPVKIGMNIVWLQSYQSYVAYHEPWSKTVFRRINKQSPVYSKYCEGDPT